MSGCAFVSHAGPLAGLPGTLINTTIQNQLLASATGAEQLLARARVSLPGVVALQVLQVLRLVVLASKEGRKTANDASPHGRRRRAGRPLTRLSRPRQAAFQRMWHRGRRRQPAATG